MHLDADCQFLVPAPDKERLRHMDKTMSVADSLQRCASSFYNQREPARCEAQQEEPIDPEFVARHKSPPAKDMRASIRRQLFRSQGSGVSFGEMTNQKPERGEGDSEIRDLNADYPAQRNDLTLKDELFQL